MLWVWRFENIHDEITPAELIKGKKKPSLDFPYRTFVPHSLASWPTSSNLRVSGLVCGNTIP